MHVIPQTKYFLESPIACVMKKLAVFPINIAPIYPYMISQIYFGLIYIVTELTQVNYSLLLKHFNKMRLW